MRKKIFYALILGVMLFMFSSVPVFAGGAESCREIFGTETDELLRTVITILFWAFPVLTIIYTTIEAFKAVADGSAEGISYYIKRFGMRIIIIIIVILAKPILQFIFSAFGLEYCILG